MWEICFYASDRGEEPVKSLIDSLQVQAQAKAIRKVDLLEEFGINLTKPHSKQLEASLYELIIHGRQEIRIFYCFIGHQVYLLHGFVKKTQKTPPKEIDIARKRRNELT